MVEQAKYRNKYEQKALNYKKRLAIQRCARAKAYKQAGPSSPVSHDSLDFADDRRDSDLINLTVFDVAAVP
jgi:hypothetical protein